MKKRIAWLLFTLIVGGTLYYSWASDGVDEVYLLPEQFEGCAVIYYNTKNAKPLKIINNTITYNIPTDGKLYTSSPPEFGWKIKSHSGWHQVSAYYVDRQGNRISQLPESKIHFGGNGSREGDNVEPASYKFQVFGDADSETLSCPPDLDL